MSIKNRKEFTRDQIADVIARSSTMNAAAKLLGVDWRTFRWNAEAHGLYSPSQPGNNKRLPLDEILDGLHPGYPTSHLRKRLLREGVKKHICEECKNTVWNGQPIPLELNHKDGDNGNHWRENLELLCPNCHSQTPTYRNKKRQA